MNGCLYLYVQSTFKGGILKRRYHIKLKLVSEYPMEILDVNSSIYNVPYINFLDADELLKEVLVFVPVILDKVDTQ